MRDGLRGLTTRGRSFLAAGLAAAVSAGILGEKDLLRVAVLLAVLPLLAALYVGRSRYKLACHRSLEPHRVPVGASARMVLRLQNMSRLPTGTLLLEDRLPYALGSRPGWCWSGSARTRPVRWRTPCGPRSAAGTRWGRWWCG
ncbi:hypothetical protein Jiend_45720 [Micromonospora endophytica]|nr:hypothetical protein Jiend_45720 [Micromonospora endophytica]